MLKFTIDLNNVFENSQNQCVYETIFDMRFNNCLLYMKSI